MRRMINSNIVCNALFTGIESLILTAAKVNKPDWKIIYISYLTKASVLSNY